MRRPNHCRSIQTARMQNQTSRQAVFSKRRFGLFKKASEISTLCGADVSIVSIVVRFLKEDLTPGTNDPNPIIIAQQNANVDYINRNLNTLEKELAKEKLRFSGLKNLCEALQAADEEVERVMS
uniref:MADS-box domain-containing protein n=1 Tax=Solanum lycopersicum TaxID=4081 RepID=A0A3Q7EEN0_SOLLC